MVGRMIGEWVEMSVMARIDNVIVVTCNYLNMINNKHHKKVVNSWNVLMKVK